ncbi:hypothetical protein PGR6_19390 [Pseudomonas sp. GR 6-02]|nr:hypothetical protein PGR6_19390 [Pseudomonas sp. GR 6-02]
MGLSNKSERCLMRKYFSRDRGGQHDGRYECDRDTKRPHQLIWLLRFATSVMRY